MKKIQVNRLILVMIPIVILALAIIAGYLIRVFISPVRIDPQLPHTYLMDASCYREDLTSESGYYSVSVIVQATNLSGQARNFTVTADLKEEFEAGLIAERYVTCNERFTVRPHNTEPIMCEFRTDIIADVSFTRSEIPRLSITLTDTMEDGDAVNAGLPAAP